MNPVRVALAQALEADSTLTGLLATPVAIHADRAPQGAPRPYVVFHKASGPRRWTFDDYTSWPTYVVKAVTRTGDAYDAKARAEAIDQAIDGALSDKTLVIAGHEHLFLRRESDVEFADDDAGETVFYVGGTYRFMVAPLPG